MNPKPRECDGCPRFNSGRGFVPGDGPLDARLIVLGEQPGTNEVNEGKPFVGASGYELNRGLGSTRASTYITNVRKCLGAEGESQALRKASIDFCVQAYLSGEFSLLSGARTLLAVGADALDVVCGRRDVMKTHGSTYTRAEVESMRNFNG